MFLTDLAAVLRAAGQKVVEVPGWQTRAAGSPGGFAPRGILVHHTGSTGEGLGYARWMALTGRSDLSAPLANLSLGRDGTWYVLAAGRAHHAGRCRPVAGLSTYPGLSYGDGNAQLLGIECHNTGTEGWPPAQRDALVTGCAALNIAHGWPAEMTLGHIETSTAGKWDPGKLPLDQLRGDIADEMEGNPDMVTVEEIWGARIGRGENRRTTAQVLASADANAAAAHAQVAVLAGQVAGLTAAVETLAARPDASAGDVAAAVRDALDAYTLQLVRQPAVGAVEVTA